jgi:predicted amidohydrolase YtcJ
MFVSFPANAGDVADAVYHNGTIHTVNGAFETAQALAVREGVFIYAGDNETALALAGEGTKVVDLEGKTVIPGIVEAHLHYPLLGQMLLQVQAHWKPKEEILAAVEAAYPVARENGEWIVGRGWNQEVWEGQLFPIKEELDAVALDVPVVLRRTCGHAAWVNSKALEMGGITRETPDPQGGEIIKDAQGEPTGVLIDTAMNLVTNLIPPFTEEQHRRALLAAQEELLGYGITTAHDLGSSMEMIGRMEKLYESGDLKIRLYVMGSSGGYGQSAEDAYNAFYEVGPRIGLYDNRLTVRAVKFFADGSLGARSAWMLEEYSDKPGHIGNPRYGDEEIYQLVLGAQKAGFQASTHAIGDGANHQILNAYERVLGEVPEPQDHRFRIEHAQVILLEDIPRFAQLHILPSMQSVHATSDKNMAEDRVGPERIKGAYAWRKLLDAGSILPNGSDAPVELVNPFHGFYAAVTRMDREGTPEGGWYPEEKMTREEMLRSFTNWGAYAGFEEDIKGSIETGKLADFVVLDRDPMSCPEDELKDIQALLTVVGGAEVFSFH